MVSVQKITQFAISNYRFFLKNNLHQLIYLIILRRSIKILLLKNKLQDILYFVKMCQNNVRNIS